jgi:hypothetical protein
MNSPSLIHFLMSQLELTSRYATIYSCSPVHDINIQSTVEYNTHSYPIYDGTEELSYLTQELPL